MQGRDRKQQKLQDKPFSDSPSTLTVQHHRNIGTQEPHRVKNNENGE